MNLVVDDNKKTIRYYFDGVNDLMETAGRWKKPKNNYVKEEVEIHDNCFSRPDSWNGNHTLEDVANELLKPTPKMNGVIESGESMFTSEDWATQKPRRKIKRRLEDGEEIDIDRWREREPDMWEESHKVKGLRFGVKIGVNIATSACVREDGFKWRTSTVVAILRICEELLIPCEVNGYNATQRGVWKDGNNYMQLVEVPLKRPEQLLDIDLLGYCLGSQSFYRTAMLGGMLVATMEHLGDKYYTIDGMLGVPDAWPTNDPNEFVLDRGCVTEKNAKREVKRFKDWLMEVKRKAGINFMGLDTIAV